MKAKDPTLEYLRQKIRGHMNDTSDNMINGACEDFGHYKHYVGIVEGLALAERELLDADELQYTGDDD